jgi:hypothetical protein
LIDRASHAEMDGDRVRSATWRVEVVPRYGDFGNENLDWLEGTNLREERANQKFF